MWRHNGLNPEADIKSSIKPDIKEICKNIKQCYSSQISCFEKSDYFS